MHQKNILRGGNPEAKKALIMVHGRGASAEDIMSLTAHLEVKDFLWLAPQATNHTWYPFSFMAPPAQNEPWLSSAIELIGDVVKEAKSQGLGEEQLRFAIG